MKKKTIERLPFLTLTEVHRGKTAKYVAVTDVREISGELFKNPHSLFSSAAECIMFSFFRLL